MQELKWDMATFKKKKYSVKLTGNDPSWFLTHRSNYFMFSLPYPQQKQQQQQNIIVIIFH